MPEPEMNDDSRYNRLRVLAVDDHEISLKLLSRQLEVLGVRDLDTASNGAQAEEKLESGTYDIVIMDWSMPVKDGFALLQSCRAQERFKNVAFVMLSSEAQKESIARAIEAGATSYIMKPMTQGQLQEKMDKVIDWLDTRKD
jgi:CheY-like chemotaxis protein